MDVLGAAPTVAHGDRQSGGGHGAEASGGVPCAVAVGIAMESIGEERTVATPPGLDLGHEWFEGGGGALDREGMPTELAHALLLDDRYQPGPRPAHFEGAREKSMRRVERVFKEMEPVLDPKAKAKRKSRRTVDTWHTSRGAAEFTRLPLRNPVINRRYGAVYRLLPGLGGPAEEDEIDANTVGQKKKKSQRQRVYAYHEYRLHEPTPSATTPSPEPRLQPVLYHLLPTRQMKAKKLVTTGSAAIERQGIGGAVLPSQHASLPSAPTGVPLCVLRAEKDSEGEQDGPQGGSTCTHQAEGQGKKRIATELASTVFMKFQRGNMTVGSVEQGGGGLVMNSCGGDIAEWHKLLPTAQTFRSHAARSSPRHVHKDKDTPNAATRDSHTCASRSAGNSRPLQEGDVVGLIDGGLTLDTTCTNAVGVVSRKAMVEGSIPAVSPGAAIPAGDTVAYAGRVPVRIRGPIRCGERVACSGLCDGTGVRATHTTMAAVGHVVSLGKPPRRDGDVWVVEIVVAPPGQYGNQIAKQRQGWQSMTVVRKTRQLPLLWAAISLCLTTTAMIWLWHNNKTTDGVAASPNTSAPEAAPALTAVDCSPSQWAEVLSACSRAAVGQQQARRSALTRSPLPNETWHEPLLSMLAPLDCSATHSRQCGSLLFEYIESCYSGPPTQRMLAELSSAAAIPPFLMAGGNTLPLQRPGGKSPQHTAEQQLARSRRRQQGLSETQSKATDELRERWFHERYVEREPGVAKAPSIYNQFNPSEWTQTSMQLAYDLRESAIVGSQFAAYCLATYAPDRISPWSLAARTVSAEIAVAPARMRATLSRDGGQDGAVVEPQPCQAAAMELASSCASCSADSCRAAAITPLSIATDVLPGEVDECGAYSCVGVPMNTVCSNINMYMGRVRKDALEACGSSVGSQATEIDVSIFSKQQCPCLWEAKCGAAITSAAAVARRCNSDPSTVNLLPSTAALAIWAAKRADFEQRPSASEQHLRESIAYSIFFTYLTKDPSLPEIDEIIRWVARARNGTVPCSEHGGIHGVAGPLCGVAIDVG